MQGTEAVRWLPAVSLYHILLQTAIRYKNLLLVLNKNKRTATAGSRQPQAITLPHSKVKHHHKLVSLRPSPFSCKAAHLLPVTQHRQTSPGVFICFHTPLRYTAQWHGASACGGVHIPCRVHSACPTLYKKKQHYTYLRLCVPLDTCIQTPVVKQQKETRQSCPQAAMPFGKYTSQ